MVTCLCNNADYCNGNTNLRLDLHLRIVALVILLLGNRPFMDVLYRGTWLQMGLHRWRIIAGSESHKYLLNGYICDVSMKLIYHSSIPGNKDMNRKRSFCKLISTTCVFKNYIAKNVRLTFSLNNYLDLDCLHENSYVFAVYLTIESF